MPMTLYLPIHFGGKNRKMPISFPTRFFCSICILCIYFILFSHRAAALTIDENQQYGFAETLFNSKQYHRAAEEYERFAFFFPFDRRKRSALFKAGQAYLLSKDPLTAIDRFKLFTQEKNQDNLVVEAYFMLVECHLVMDAPGRAIVEMNNLIAENNNPDINDRANYRLGWLYIDQGNWAAAQRAFSNISNSQHDQYQLTPLEDELNQASQLPTRSPLLAGMLSIIPGSGQLYCNRYEDALIAFFVNLGLFWAAHDAFDQEQYALGGLLTFVGSGFYIGNIYSATSDAHKFNRQRKSDFVHSLKNLKYLGNYSFNT